MLTVPTLAVPSQTLRATLGGQDCGVHLYARSTGLFCDVSLGGALVIGGVPVLHANLIVRSAYLGFVGDLAVYDTQGSADPVWTGLGTRWLLVYVEAADLVAAGLTG